MKICISEATTLPSSFEEDVKGYAGCGVHAMEVWLTKLEKHLENHSLEETRSLLSDHQMILPAASYQGGILLSQGAQKQATYDHFKRRLDLCQALDIRTLLVVADFVNKVDPAQLQYAVNSLRTAAQWAEGFNVCLALEFRAKNSFCSCLDTAASLIHACGEKNIGIAFDVFHYYTGCSKQEDLGLLNSSNLSHVHVCDLSGIPRELATDSDRIFPGEGDFDLLPILNHFKAINYQGWLSLELMNPMIWEAKCSTVASMGLASMNALLQRLEKTENKNT